MGKKRFSRLGETAGYTAVEAMTVVAVMGVCAAFTAPSMLRFQSAQSVQSATSEVGGMLRNVRSRAVGEATPYLVLFQKEEVTDGERSAFALIVKDADRSYTVTPPDDVQTFVLGPEVKPQVRQYGESELGTSFGELTAPETDRSILVASTDLSVVASTDLSGSGSSGSGSSGSGSGDLLGGVTEVLGGLLGGSESSGSGSSGSGSEAFTSIARESTSTELVEDVATNGTTFPVSEDAGVPSIAFNERGIPVSLDSPEDWGTGAGAVYLTDNETAVYAAVVSPLGEVSLARYDAKSSSWR